MVDLCPIETPEGPNIGLISSLGVYAKVNNVDSLKHLTARLKKVWSDSTDEPIYLSAEEEEGMKIAQANIEMDAKGKFESRSYYCP
jgi:DNA-directed RNA polymerase subunit beta